MWSGAFTQCQFVTVSGATREPRPARGGFDTRRSRYFRFLRSRRERHHVKKRGGKKWHDQRDKWADTVGVNDSSHRALTPTRLASQSSFSCCSHFPQRPGRSVSWCPFDLKLSGIFLGLTLTALYFVNPCQVVAGLQFNLRWAAKDRADRTDHYQLTKRTENTRLQLEALIVSSFTALCSLLVEKKQV